MGAFPQHMGGEAVEGVGFSGTLIPRFGAIIQSRAPHDPVSSAHPWAVEVDAGRGSPGAQGRAAPAGATSLLVWWDSNSSPAP
jgi:hypothetical protein